MLQVLHVGCFFSGKEVSAGVYRVRCVDEAGRSVEATGTDPEALVEECKQAATRIYAAGRTAPCEKK